MARSQNPAVESGFERDDVVIVDRDHHPNNGQIFTVGKTFTDHSGEPMLVSRERSVPADGEFPLKVNARRCRLLKPSDVPVSIWTGSRNSSAALVEADCERCGCNRARSSHLHGPDEARETCVGCGHTIFSTF